MMPLLTSSRKKRAALPPLSQHPQYKEALSDREKARAEKAAVERELQVRRASAAVERGRRERKRSRAGEAPLPRRQQLSDRRAAFANPDDASPGGSNGVRQNRKR